MEKFTDSLADDLNISAALASVYDLIREVNTLYDAQKIGAGEAAVVVETMRKFDSILDVMSFETVEDSIPQNLKDALVKRNEARKMKDWATADQLRDLILNSGYIIEDTPSGATLKKVEVS